MNQYICFLFLALGSAGVSEEYDYVRDTNRYVSLERGETMSIRKLDATGNFDPDPRFHNLNVHGGLSSCPPYTLLNPRKEQVYEYRSGQLILGEIDKGGNFVPRVDSKVIAFKDYHYTEGSLRIYNLPGYYVRKGQSKRK